MPKQYETNKPACLMVFQDGIQYSAPEVFNNLINRKEIPVTIGVFVMHGRVKALSTNALDRYNIFMPAGDAALVSPDHA